MMRATMSTRPLTNIHRLLLAFDATRRTDLRRCAPGVCLDERPSVEGTFVFQLSDELVPTDIPDGLGELMVLHHVLRLQCLHDDDLVLVNDSSRQFVEEVLALVCDFLVSLGEDQPGFFTILASDFLSRQRALRLLDLRFGLSEKARVVNLLRDHRIVRHDGEMF